MPTSVTFILKDPKSIQPTLIYLIFRFNSYSYSYKNDQKKYERLKISTGLKWKPADWNSAKYRGRDKSGSPDPTELNQRLTNMETVIADLHRKMINDNLEVTLETIRGNLEKRTDVFPDLRKKVSKETAIRKSKDLISFFENYISTTKYVYKNGKPYEMNPRTRQRYATTLRHLKEYAATKAKVLNFNDINLSFYQDFVAYLRTEVHKKPSKSDPKPSETIKMADNTVGKHISTLKTVLNAATEAGVNKNTTFKSQKFATISEDVEKIYLTQNELDKIFELDLTSAKSLERVRDLFLIGSYTCLRFADFSNIKKDNIYNNDKGTFLKITTAKSGQGVIIPIHKVVLEIMTKYDYKLPQSISNQKMNDYLKEIGKRADISDPVIITKFEGGVKVSKTFRKYELISTHTARRSGATNMFLSGIPAISIMKITGHKTEKAFMRYIQMSQEDNANLLIDHPFFK